MEPRLAPSPANGEYPPSGGVGLRLVARGSYQPKEGDVDDLAFRGGAGIRECENINNDWFRGCIALGRAFFPELTVESFEALVRFQRDPMTMSP